jgi:hypothetical protein
VLIEQIISIEQAVVFPIFVVHLGHAAILHQFLDHPISEVLELDVEVELDVLHVLSGGQDILESAVDVWLDLS